MIPIFDQKALQISIRVLVLNTATYPSLFAKLETGLLSLDTLKY